MNEPKQKHSKPKPKTKTKTNTNTKTETKTNKIETASSRLRHGDKEEPAIDAILAEGVGGIGRGPGGDAAASSIAMEMGEGGSEGGSGRRSPGAAGGAYHDLDSASSAPAGPVRDNASEEVVRARFTDLGVFGVFGFIFVCYRRGEGSARRHKRVPCLCIYQDCSRVR